MLHSGLGYIAQALENNGLDYDVFDMSLGYSDADLMQKIKMYKPSLVGITMPTYRHKENYVRINAIKQNFPAVKIAAGGPNISLMRERALMECKWLDYGVVLEGEETMVELCSGVKDLRDIKGLIFRQEWKVIFNGERDFCAELDNVDFPRYNKFDLKRYLGAKTANSQREIPIVTSRGCTAACAACYTKTAMGHKIRYRSPGSIINEIKYWYEKGYRAFRVADDNFSTRKDRALHICRLIKESGMKELALSCGNGIRAGKVDEEILTAMKDVGFRDILFEIDSGSGKVMRTLKKIETPAVVEAAVKTALKLGFDVSASFFIGLLGETKEDIEESFALANKYPFSDVRFYHPVPYPGTGLYDWIKKLGCFIVDPQQYLHRVLPSMNNPVFFTPELSEEDRKEIFVRAAKLSKEIRVRDYKRKLRAAGVPRAFLRLLAKIYKIRAGNGIG